MDSEKWRQETLKFAAQMEPGLVPKAMFGGVALMMNGHMAACVFATGLLVRVGAAARDDVLNLPGARPFAPGGRAMRAFVQVDRAQLQNDDALRHWLSMGIAFASTLPAKKNDT